MTKKIIIIGSGFGGLTAAALLAKEGHEVHVLEKNSMPGGRAIQKTVKGFTFDMGPSWYLMPEVFERLYTELGTTVEDHLTLTKLDPAYRIFCDGEVIDIPTTRKELIALFEKYETGAGKKLVNYLNTAKRQYEIAMQDFIYKSYDSITDIIDIRLVTEGVKLNLFGNLHSYVKKEFTDHRLQKILEYLMVFLGGSPNNTPALYSIMSHVDLNAGVFYPTYTTTKEGKKKTYSGMHALAQSLHDIAVGYGATFQFNTPVKEILHKHNDIVGVKTQNNSTIIADIVIANADYEHVDSKLLGEHANYSTKYWEKRVIAPSGFILYLGLKKKIPGLTHHNLFLEKNWNEHFSDIFDNPQWPDNPSYYVCCPTTTDPSVAPKNKENLFFLVPVAPGLEDTAAIRKKYTEKTIHHFENSIGTNITDLIEVQEVFAHNDFKSLYNAYKGTALGLSHTLSQTAIFRPKHKHKKIRNLYYTGHYTNPGIGVPIVVISSQLITQTIKKENPIEE